MQEAYTKKSDQLIRYFKTDFKKGLGEKEAVLRLSKYGKNQVTHKKKISKFKIFLRQFKNPLIYILFVAVLISLLIKHFLDASVIFAILLLNSLFGYFQEHKAEKSLELLKKIDAPHAKVIRNGIVKIIKAENVVPGDILVLETGDKIPADARLLKIFSLQTNEAILTGESSPVNKNCKILSEKVPIADQTNMVFSGTVITYGHGFGVVISTGNNSEFGKIAKSLAEIKPEVTPLQKSLSFFSKKIGFIVLGVVFVLFLIGLLRNLNFLDTFMLALSLAVAAIPEGLPAVVTITLALGTQRMVKKNTLIRKLSAIETLGSSTVICSDKTGTLTSGEMIASHIYDQNNIIGVSGEGYSTDGRFSCSGNTFDPKRIEKLLECAWLCNNSNLKGLIGNPTELALKVLAKKGGIDTKFYRVDEIPFDSQKKYMVTIDQNGNKKVLHMKGAPEVVLDKCKYISYMGRNIHFTSKQKEKILNMNAKMARKALRVLGFAYSLDGTEQNLVFLGLIGIRDPPRKEAKKAIRLCKKAGIRVIMITGDNAITAQAVARELNLGTEIMTGRELDKLSNTRLFHLVKQIDIFARVNPEHKVRILKALQKNDEIVVMTGDGINDAPALKKANVGVAMGISGTDVSREASDMVLLNDSFSSIVLAIKEGRTIFDNIKKFFRFLLSANLGEIGIIVVALLAGFPLPLLPLHILWVNLVTDGFPALALGADPSNRDIMYRKPRDQKKGILHGSLGFLIFVGVLATVLTLSIFFLEYSSGLDKARTMALMTLVMFELFLVFSIRSEKKSMFSFGLFSNKFLVYAILFSLILQGLLIYTPLRELFGLVSLGLIDLGKVTLVSLFGVFVLEIRKKFLK